MKKLFLLLLLSFSSFLGFGQLKYSGFIGTLPIAFYTAQDSPQVNSSYSYTNHIETIKLKVELTEVDGRYTSKIVFYERDKNGKNTATLTFENFDTKKEKLTGIWTDLNSKKQLTIALVKNKVRPLSKKDATIITTHLKKLRDAEGYDEEAENSVGGTRWNTGTVHYAPDGAFKLFVFEGEGCGGNCNPLYDSFIQLKSGKIIKRSDEDSFAPIDSLYKTGPNTYATIERSWSGGNIGRVSCHWSQFSITQGRLQYLKNGTYDVNSHNTLAVAMKYDSAHKKVLFRYERRGDEFLEIESPLDSDKELWKKIPKELLPIQDYELLVVKGEFTLVNGKITNIREWYDKELELYDDN